MAGAFDLLLPFLATTTSNAGRRKAKELWGRTKCDMDIQWTTRREHRQLQPMPAAGVIQSAGEARPDVANPQPAPTADAAGCCTLPWPLGDTGAVSGCLDVEIVGGHQKWKGCMHRKE